MFGDQLSMTAFCALIKLGGGVTDIRGAIGGSVFSRGKGGNIIRKNAKPINPRSDRQETRRGNMAYLARYWSKTLTAAQRADWNAYASGSTWTNRLGETIEINGNAAFMRLNALLLLIGEAVRAAAPTAMGHAGGITIDFDAESDNTVIEMDEPGGAWDKDLDDDWVVLFQALPVEAGRAQGTKGFRYIGAIEGDSGTPPTFPNDQTAAYTMVSGQNVTVKAIHIDPDFRVSSPTFKTVAAAPSV